jgi:hypothetical protein
MNIARTRFAKGQSLAHNIAPRRFFAQNSMFLQLATAL